MKFNKGEFYRHDRTLDSDIWVVKVLGTTKEYTELVIHFVDRKHILAFELNYTTKIAREDYDFWKKIV